jgi:hypothetical protein
MGERRSEKLLAMLRLLGHRDAEKTGKAMGTAWYRYILFVTI